MVYDSRPYTHQEIMVDGTPDPIDRFPQIDPVWTADILTTKEPSDISDVSDRLQSQMPELYESPKLDITNRSGLLDDNDRVRKLNHRDYTTESLTRTDQIVHGTDVETISLFLDEIHERLIQFRNITDQNWTTEDCEELDIIHTILDLQLPRVLAPIGAPDEAHFARCLRREFKDVFGSRNDAWERLSNEMAPKQFVPTHRQARAYEIIEALKSLSNDTPANVRKFTLAKAKRLRRNIKGLRPHDIEALEEAYANAKAPSQTLIEPVELPVSVVTQAALAANTPTPVMVEEFEEEESIESWAHRNHIDNLLIAQQIRETVKDLDLEASKLAKEYEKAGDDQLEIMKELFQLTLKRIGYFPSTESFNFHLALLLGRESAQLNDMDLDCMQTLRERNAERMRAANKSTQDLQLQTPEGTIDPDSAWGAEKSATTTQVTTADSSLSDTVVDAKVPEKGALPRGEHPPSPSLDNDATRERAATNHLKLIEKRTEMGDRQAIDQAVREELERSRGRDTYNRKAWGAIVSTAAAAVLFVAGAMGLNQETDTESKADQNPSAQSLTDASDAPELSTDALDEEAVQAKVEVPENTDDLAINSYTNLWEAAADLHPSDSLVAKNIAVATVADAVNTNASSELALDSLPSGYTAIQDSSCASYPQVGAMLDCVSTQFNQSVSDQVAGELVFNGFVNPEINFDPLATAVDTLNTEEAPKQIASATEELQEKQAKHPEWFSESQDVASPDTVEKDDAARASLKSEPVKVDKPSLEQRARGWWRSAKKKVSSFFA